MQANFDYIVVGGGSAGCVVAARLSEEPGVTVCLLEAGAPDNSAFVQCPSGVAVVVPYPVYNWAFQTKPNPGLNGRIGYQPRGKGMGGSSSINAMMYIRGDKSDYDRWAAQGNPGWSYAEVLPYFKKSENNETFGDSEYHGAGGPLNVAEVMEPSAFSHAYVEAAIQAGHARNRDFNGANLEGVGLTQVSQKDGERCSAAKAYITPNLGRPNLKVITRAHTTRILLEGKRAVGVEYRDAGGKAHRLHAAREVILAAGAFQSPQLLMLSGIGPKEELQKHGITVAHDLPGVGQNLQDHVDIVHSYEVGATRELIGLSLSGAWRILRGIFAWPRRRGPLTSNFAEGTGFIKTAPGEAVPDIQLVFVIAKLMNHGRDIVLGNGFSMHAYLLRPKSRGSVSLASGDPLAPPAIDTNFLAEQDDLDRLVRALKMVRTIARQPALKALWKCESKRSAHAQTDAEIAELIRNRADSVYHPIGTCKMGPASDAMAVVDHELRVKGISSLRVVDASIMPDLVSGNTNAPAIMIGEKAADMIKAARQQA